MLLSAVMNPKKSPHVQIIIQEKIRKALLDIGVSHCFINTKTANKFKLTINKIICSPVMVGNSCSIMPIGSCILSFKLGERAFTHEFFVLNEIPLEFVIGSDFITLSKLVPKLHEGIYYFDDENLDKITKINFLNQEYFLALQGLDSSQDQQLNSLLSEFPDVLSDKIGTTNQVECKLNMTCTEPIASRPYRTSLAKKQIIKTHVTKMLKLGIIRHSESE